MFKPYQSGYFKLKSGKWVTILVHYFMSYMYRTICIKPFRSQARWKSQYFLNKKRLLFQLERPPQQLRLQAFILEEHLPWKIFFLRLSLVWREI